MKKFYMSSEKTNAPLSGACKVGNLVFVSGQIHIDSSGKLVGNSIEEKFNVALSNLKKVLEEAKLKLKDVIRVQLYLTDLNQLPSLNKEYLKNFKHPLPVRTAIGVKELPLGASLEIDVIASRN